MIDFVNVSKAYGSQVLLRDASFRIGDNERIGLVGANGSGKTTLFRLISDMESPDNGVIQKKRGLTIGFLPQEIDSLREGNVLDEVLAVRPQFLEAYTERVRLERMTRHPDCPEDLLRKKAYLDSHYEELGGDTVKARAEEILGGLGFLPEDFGRSLSTLSGGWHMRVRLASLLMSEPELLLLDEPTNHLDLPSMVWFEQYLRAFPGAYLIVAHDREFINRTVSRIIEVDRGGLGLFTGDYDYYRMRKEDLYVHRARAFRAQQVKIRDMEDFIARNRVRKDRAGQVQSRIKQLEKIERLEAPRSVRGIGFDFPQPERAGAQALSLVEFSKRFGDKIVFDRTSLVLSRGDKAAVIGVNGKGKSTLLKIAAGELAPDEGRRQLGYRAQVGYFAQHQLEALDPKRTVLEEMYTAVRGETMSQVRSMLGAFLFSGEDVEKKVTVLSGGEKSRLALAKLLMRPANLLIMDEPTNHLDIASREVLETALKKYEGTLLLSSHDRRFIDAVATRTLEIEEGRLEDHPGNYSYYLWKREQEAALREEEQSGQGSAVTVRDSTPRDSRKERKRREAELRNELYRLAGPLKEKAAKLEAGITRLEGLMGGLERELADPAIYSVAPEKARCKAGELAGLRRELNDCMDSWETATVAAEEAEAEVRARYEDLE